jgi:pyruvate formate lyase activating enzyme
MIVLVNKKPAKYWKKIDNEKIQCDLCPRHCKLSEGQHGFCLVRFIKDNQLVTMAYGQSSGFSVDPIEKKPLHHFLPGTQTLSFGTIGCNLACKFCQNYHISRSKNESDFRINALPYIIVKKAKELSCKSVSFTYNEPITFFEYAVDTAKACHEANIKTVAVTAGYICDEPRKEFFKHIDAANVDLKAFTESFYRKITNSHLKPILDTLYYIKNYTNTWLEITTLLIPGKNDSEKEINALSKWIIENLGQNVPLHFSAFHPTYKMLNTPKTPNSILSIAREIAIGNGLHYVYTGNVYDPEGSNTYCHNCHKCIIKRNFYKIEDYNLTENGLCRFCGTQCSGVF